MKILCLDVSTNTIGIALFNTSGDLLEVTHISPKDNKKKDKRDEMYEKITSISSFFEAYIAEHQVSKIVIEEPLKNSANPNVASKLNFFGGMLYQELKKYVEDIEYIDINESRQLGIPEIIGDNGKMYSNISKEIGGVKISEYRKLITLFIISKKYPDVVWLLSKNLLLDKKNFDRADAITLGLAFFSKNNILKQNIVAIENLEDFLGGYIKYNKFCNENVDKNNTLLPQEKISVKKQYLTEQFVLKNFINVNLQ